MIHYRDRLFSLLRDFMPLSLLFSVFATSAASPQRLGQVQITLDGSAPRVDVSRSLYGIFVEDINHAGEGGLYAEMVQNRDFEANTLPANSTWAGNLIRTSEDWHERQGFGNSLSPWRLVESAGAVGAIKQVNEQPLNIENPHSMKVEAKVIGGGLAVINDGFWGMNMVAGNEYNLSFYARTENGISINIAVALQGEGGRANLAESQITVRGSWKQYHLVLTPSSSDVRGRLSLGFPQPGTVWLDVVSLFPKKTFKGRSNGMRPDLVGTVEALHPAFVRFPGGGSFRRLEPG